MTTALVVTITDELVAELERHAVNLCNRGRNLTPTISAEELSALLSERAELKRDSERYHWMRKRISLSQYYILGAELTSNTPDGVDQAIDQAMQERQK